MTTPPTPHLGPQSCPIIVPHFSLTNQPPPPPSPFSLLRQLPGMISYGYGAVNTPFSTYGAMATSLAPMSLSNGPLGLADYNDSFVLSMDSARSVSPSPSLSFSLSPSPLNHGDTTTTQPAETAHQGPQPGSLSLSLGEESSPSAMDDSPYQPPHVQPQLQLHTGGNYVTPVSNNVNGSAVLSWVNEFQALCLLDENQTYTPSQHQRKGSPK